MKLVKDEKRIIPKSVIATLILGGLVGLLGMLACIMRIGG